MHNVQPSLDFSFMFWVSIILIWRFFEKWHKPVEFKCTNSPLIIREGATACLDVSLEATLEVAEAAVNNYFLELGSAT